MSQDHELQMHRDWIGLLRPVGLVVSAPALIAAQAIPDKNIAKEQQTLASLLTPPAAKDAKKKDRQTQSLPLDFHVLATQVLGWKTNKLVPTDSLPESLAIFLPEFGETLRPTYAVPAPPDPLEQRQTQNDWLLLVQELPDGTSFDEPPPEDGKHWRASPQVRLERLVRETGVNIGILANRRQIRLVYAPRGETSGHVTWPLHRLPTALDAPMLSSLCMLLKSARLFTLGREQRLPHILKESRKYQNVVSTKLAGQVLEALNELLRGFQSANEAPYGALWNATVTEDPDHVYGGLLAVLLRLVFILFAEERGLLSSSPVFVRNYSLLSLFDQLRTDANRFPDTMDQRRGAWSRLLVLFRMVHDGAKRGDLQLPPRYGHLFDPDTWGFLEGRAYGVLRVKGAPVDVPKVADGVLLRVLEKLILLDGDRLSYRALDVEQIGSVYENMMGFRLTRATEISLGVGKEHVVVGLETLLSKKGADREKYLKETANVDVSGKAADALKAANVVDDLVAAFGKRISPLTPRPVPKEGLFLQPTDERRRSGSHYTPRELTEPIVRTTLRPILEDLGTTPKPERILSLKVCDPAMGSGAFLVETCRQLAEQLVKAYDVHGRPRDVAPDEDILLYAMRQVAQHCLYGVDKNGLAVNLGKLSLWLATLARTHAFTFLDHAIRHGDSLVGLSREQITSFHWAPEKQVPTIRTVIDKAIAEALTLRLQIPELANSDNVFEKQCLLKDADDAIAKVRLIGDAVVASFFSDDKPKGREQARQGWEKQVLEYVDGGDGTELEGLVADLREGDKPVPCFHWEVEFPEVFTASRGGFDAMVGNPPFMGGKNISGALSDAYLRWLIAAFPPAGGQADLVAYFFRRAFLLLRDRGSFGLLSTNTIAQGDTRRAALTPIISGGGNIYAAIRRLRWPGRAAVVVSVVHFVKGPVPGWVALDGRPVSRITAFLLHSGGSEDPLVLKNNEDVSFCGAYIYGEGFTFDDARIGATEIATMSALLAKDERNAERIFPYLGGEEILGDPRHTHRRFVIDFGSMSESDARQWPDLMAIVEAKVKPSRLAQKRERRAEFWWQFGEVSPGLRKATATLRRMLVHPFTSTYLAFAFVPFGTVVASPHVVFALESNANFGVLQSRIHEVWARLTSSTFKDDLRYAASDCFATFPFPAEGSCEKLESAGGAYYQYRADLLVQRDEGLTALYHRFHDPDESDPDIVQLRDLHAAMDRAVLDAYGWTDIQPTCEFLLDYEEEDDDESATKRRKKKPWRYRWPDEIRDEVLARLLDLNAQRAKEQAAPPPALTVDNPPPAAKKRAPSKKKAAATTEDQRDLFGKKTD